MGWWRRGGAVIWEARRLELATGWGGRSLCYLCIDLTSSLFDNRCARHPHTSFDPRSACYLWHICVGFKIFAPSSRSQYSRLTSVSWQKDNIDTCGLGQRTWTAGARAGSLSPRQPGHSLQRWRAPSPGEPLTGRPTQARYGCILPSQPGCHTLRGPACVHDCDEKQAAG